MRTPPDSVTRAAVFVLVVVLVVAGVAAVPWLSITLGGDQKANYPEYEASAIVPDRAPTDGVPQVDRADAAGVVLVDNAHANRFDEGDIQPLLTAIAASGYRIEFLGPTEDFDAALSRADGFLVVDPGFSYTRAEVDRVESFVDAGGRLVMLGEPTQATLTGSGLFVTISTATNRLAPLSSRFGIEFGTGYLYNMQKNDGNFRNIFADPAERSPITRGLDRVALYTATRVSTTTGSGTLAAADGTRSVRGDTLGDYPVAAVSGNVLAVGDTTFIERGNYNVVDNERLIGNIARFLTGGSRSRTLLDYPHVVGEAPTVTYTSVALLDSAQVVASDLRDAGLRPTVSLRRGSGAAGEADILFTTNDYLEANAVGGGITAQHGRIAVAGYESDASGVIVIRAPRNGPDVIVVVDGPTRARRAARILTSGTLDQYLIDDRTAVVRTASAGPPSADNVSG